MAKTISNILSEGSTKGHWITPTITMVNGVPGSGKTTWIRSNFNAKEDLIITATTEAAYDLRVRLEPRLGTRARVKVRTMASLLVSGVHKGETYKRLIVDEALMNHFGAVVMATQIAKAVEILMIGDENQIPFIDRNNLFSLAYNRPNLTTTKKLLCTFRNHLDVAYALQEVYGGICSANLRVRSLSLKKLSGAAIPKAKGTLYLTHTQKEKSVLISQGLGIDEDSRTLPSTKHRD
jgi:hypothetical protein